MQMENPVPRGSAEPQWRRPYATTMEQSGSFTVPSSGFVTATVHQAALAEAGIAEGNRAAFEDATRRRTEKKTTKATTQRSANQMSMLGFLGRNKAGAAAAAAAQRTGTAPSQKPAPRGHVSQSQMQQMHQQAAARLEAARAPVIAAELANHRLGATNAMRRPAALTRTENEPVTQYGNFSSPPGMPAVVVENIGAVLMKPPQPPARPASFHSTTMTTLRATGGVKKPPGLRADGSAVMGALRKPFKPLTINRSGVGGE